MDRNYRKCNSNIILFGLLQIMDYGEWSFVHAKKNPFSICHLADFGLFYPNKCFHSSLEKNQISATLNFYDTPGVKE